MTATNEVTKPPVTFETVWVTPELAAEWIKTQEKNRPVRDRTVVQFSRDMLHGSWMNTGEPVKFDTNGHLIDGQHRLYAVVKAGIAAGVEMTVARDVPKEAMEVMDSGTKRSVSDALGLRGYANRTAVAAAARVGLSIEAEITTNASRWSHRELLEWADLHESAEEAGTLGMQIYQAVGIAPSVATFAMIKFLEIDYEDAHTFATNLVKQLGLGEKDPIRALVKRYSGTYGLSTRKLTQEEQVSLMFRAWNAWRTGVDVVRFQRASRTGAVEIPKLK